MSIRGWQRLLVPGDEFRGAGSYPIDAYSEFMPPPYLGLNPYTRQHTGFFLKDDVWGWPVTEYEEAFELRPGLQSIAQQMLGVLLHLARGEPAHGISRNKLVGNPYWPQELAQRAGSLTHERLVVILPLALSRTKDDKGRVRWTLFGGSELGPSRAFWRGFFTGPHREMPEERALSFIRRMLREAYGEALDTARDLYRAGFRIQFPEGGLATGDGNEDPRPAWTASFQWTAGQPLRGVSYLLTFLPFAELPPAVRRAYLEGRLQLLPFPGSLLFWGARSYQQLQKELPLALQIPLLHSLARHEGPGGLRVPQSGWLHEPRPEMQGAGDLHTPLRNTYIRTHRWARVHRHEDETSILAREDKLVHVLFSTEPNDVELYGKPMARNVQIWTHDYHLLLDGAHAHARELQQAFRAIGMGGQFGYRFQMPAMRVGIHEVYWHRPLVAFLSPSADKAVLLEDAPQGYLTAYPTGCHDLHHAIELWPRILKREEHLAAVELFEHSEEGHPHQTALNVRKLLDAAASLRLTPVPHSYARRLLAVGKHQSLEDWLEALPCKANDLDRGRRLAAALDRRIEKPEASSLPARARQARHSSTFDDTAKRPFEIRYWNTIRALAAGKFINKCNADCIQDALTRRMQSHHRRDLEALGDYLLSYYAHVAADCGMQGKVLIGELPFHWRTDFDFGWSGGWLDNKQERTYERNLLVIIPGQDRGRTVIMADHYDTAYMEDVYDTARGGSGARLAAAGADDNHSATAALMLAAPVFCRLSREGRLGCDVWLLHLTGEEFPSDCLGARQLCSQLVEGTLRMRLPSGGTRELSRVKVEGAYVLDMIAHNNDHARDIFQIAPGTGPQSLWLSYQAHCANESWNTSTAIWNRRPSRRGRGRGHRSPVGTTPPQIAEHPLLIGEVRPHHDPRSTLFNTDGQIFSDAGIPVVLFMENYDINRTGYHDSHDTMANIDLDYGSALAAIAIEAVARTACAERPGTQGRL